MPWEIHTYKEEYLEAKNELHLYEDFWEWYEKKL